MNNDSEHDSSDIENNSPSRSVQEIEPKKNITKEDLEKALDKYKIKKEFLGVHNKLIDSEGEPKKSTLQRTVSLKEDKGKDKKSTTQKGEKPIGRPGNRSDPGVQHLQLETFIKKKIIDTKMDLEKAISMIPICTGKKDSAEFINACEIAIKEVVDADRPVLLKIITSKLTGNALEVTKYRELDSWAAIKSILEGAFEQKISERALSAALSAARMIEGESVTKFAARIEELYYKICEASTVGLNKLEALTLKNSWRRQAMIAFMTGLPEHLYTVLKSRNPESLEQCFKVAIDEDLEYRSRLDMQKLQGNVQKQNNNNIQTGGNNVEKRQDDNNRNMFNRGGNNNRNNNFNYANRYDNNNRSGYSNRGGYANFNRGSGYRGGNNNGRNFNNNNYRQNNISQNRTGCYTCGKSNHFSKDCWQRLGNRPNTQQNAYGNNRNNGTRNSGDNNNRREGNNAQNAHCSYCNKVGHEIANCFTKQKNEKNSKNVRGGAQVGVRLVQEIIQDPQNEFFTSQQD